MSTVIPTKVATVQTIVVYGGNGFVGCKVVKALISRGHKVRSISRQGTRPVHLQSANWADNVDWLQGDACQPDNEHLSGTDTVVCLVGSPPLPTFSRKGYEQQLRANGETNVAVIQAAADVGIKRIVLLGAKIPSFLNKSWFAYAQGKRISLEVAQKFSRISEEHNATVIQPGAIYGTRHLASGRAIPLQLFMRPLSRLLNSQFVSVEQVANRIADVCLIKMGTKTSLNIITHDLI